MKVLTIEANKNKKGIQKDPSFLAVWPEGPKKGKNHN
jgi:hypothetical protein